MEHDASSSIFVSIASYRDNQCQYTIKDLFEKAKYPKRIVVGVCFQVAKEDTDNFLLDLSAWSDHIRTYFLHHTEAMGPCYARSLIQQELFKDEDYYFQIDSHFRFAENWDVMCLGQLARCKSPRPMLTAYASSYTLPKDYQPGELDRAVLAPSRAVTILCADTFGDQNQDDPFLRIKTRNCRSDFGHVPPPSLFWTARFAFSRGAAVHEVPYDPHLEYIFFGEEIAMSARLWTAGWDFFNPTQVIAYHLGSRAHRHWFRQVQTSEEQLRRETAAKRRICGLLGTRWPNGEVHPPPVAPYGLGVSRSLQEYETFIGIDFANCKFRGERCRNGGLDGDLFPPQWAEEEREKIMHASQMQDVASWAGKDNANALQRQFEKSDQAERSQQMSHAETEKALELTRMRVRSLQAQLHGGGSLESAHELELDLSSAFSALAQLEATTGQRKQAEDIYSKALEHAEAAADRYHSCDEDGSFVQARMLSVKITALLGLKKHSDAKNLLKEAVQLASEALAERRDEPSKQLAFDVLESVHSAHEQTDDRKGLEGCIRGLQLILHGLRQAIGSEPAAPVPIIRANESPPEVEKGASIQARILERIVLICIATGRDKDLNVVKKIFAEFSIARESPSLRKLLGMLQSSGIFLEN